MGPLNESRNKSRQAAADWLEAEGVERYRRQRAVTIAFAETIRRAEAAMRLEAWLRLQSR